MPRKKADKSRDAAVAYPKQSPRLLRAYRIFGPGLDKPEILDGLKNNLFISDNDPGTGETWLTPAGDEVSREVGASPTEILEAYTAYRDELERMARVEGIHAKRKQCDQAGDVDDNNWNPDDEEENSDASGSGRGRGGVRWVTQLDPSNGRARGRTHAWAEGEDPYEQFWRDPALWLGRDDAASRARAQRVAAAGVLAAADDVLSSCEGAIDAWNRDWGLVSAARACARHAAALAAYAGLLEEIVGLHHGAGAGVAAAARWESRDRPGVTFGPRVPEVLHKIYDLGERLRGLEPAVAACRRVQARLAGTRLLTEKKQLRGLLREKLVQFATLCLADEARKDFKKDIEDMLAEQGA